MKTFVPGEVLRAEDLNAVLAAADDAAMSQISTINSKLTSIENTWLENGSWVTLAANGGWAANSSLSIRRVGRTVTLTGKIANSSNAMTVNTHTGVATIPAAYRPSRDLFISGAVRVTGATPNYYTDAVIGINYSTGTLDVHANRAGAGVFFSATWVI